MDLNFARENDFNNLRVKFDAQEALVKSQAETIVHQTQEIGKRDEIIRNLRAQQPTSQQSSTANETFSENVRINNSHYQGISWDNNDNFGGMYIERTSGKIFHQGKTYESTLLLRPYKLSVKGHPTGERKLTSFTSSIYLKTELKLLR